jgi:hypothetical protein
VLAVGALRVGCWLLAAAWIALQGDSGGEGTTNMLEQKFFSDGEEVAYISRP